MTGFPDLTVTIEDAAWEDVLPGAEALCGRAARAALAAVEIDHPCEMSVVLGGDERVRDLNRTWRGQDKPTNVLSFPAGDSPMAARAQGRPELLGDVILAFGVTRREAADEGLAFEDHVTHLVVHGALHLLGYDHEDEDEADEMEALESAILIGMGLRDPYA